jgi:phosphatidylserine decarboxylase
VVAAFQIILGRVIGGLADIPVPRFLRSYVYGFFVWLWGIDATEAEFQKEHYGSVGNFFCRALRGGARKAQGPLVVPCDGTVRFMGALPKDGRLTVKQSILEPADILGSRQLADSFAGGHLVSIYLAPGDYHRVHVPCDCRIVQSKYITGTLWPVNNLWASIIPNLYSENERLVTVLETRYGQLALVMVGALNVGRIEAVYDNWPRPILMPQQVIEREYSPAIELRQLAELARFRLGSAVLLFLPPGLEDSLKQNEPNRAEPPVSAGEHVSLGDTIF